MYNYLIDYITLKEDEWVNPAHLQSTGFFKYDRSRRIKIKDENLYIEILQDAEDLVPVGTNLWRVLKNDSRWNLILKIPIYKRFTMININFDFIIDFRILGEEKYLIGIYLNDERFCFTNPDRQDFVKIQDNEIWNYTADRAAKYNNQNGRVCRPLDR